ncbi:ABC transporter ATP-binding protein [Treponema sp.]|uniref:ABC transporter ATP-binding protein n=1 Tax=Treponema sp. TaxID=166 RepID=UPI0025F60D62|nr:ABC transporter ATP-binding protein [Treponema sp.]
MNYNDKSIKIFFAYYKPHLKIFLADMFCALLIAVIDVSFPIITRYMLNTYIPQGKMTLFFEIIALIAGVYCIRWVCNWFVNYWGHYFGVKVETDMRHDVFKKLESQSFSFFDTHLTGRLMSRVTTDLFEITELAHHGPEDVMTSVLTLLGSFVLLLRIRWELAILVFAFLPLIILITMFSRRRLSNSSRKVKEKTSMINGVLENSLTGIRVTQGFTNEEIELSKFDANNVLYRDSKKQFYKTMSTFHSNVEFSTAILTLLVFAAGGYFIMKGSMTVADLVAANLFVAAFTAPVRKLVNFVEQYSTGMAGFNRFLEIMRTDTSIKEAPDAVEILSARGNITFKDVSFSYNDKTEVLKNINLEIKAGQKFAFVGASGGGKSTICNLIPRFYEVTEGNIYLDGIDLKKIKLENLRKQIGTVQQDVFLFAGTIKENIAYGKPGASDEEIIQAAKRAEIHEDILKMPEGYDTPVGERGLKLSGGQKQRVSIARCFLKNPPILILDEATSALDTATEVKIQNAFDALAKGRTTLVIAHRLSTIKNADMIAVVDDKNIEECGSHEELLAKNGKYAALWNNQVI